MTTKPITDFISRTAAWNPMPGSTRDELLRFARIVDADRTAVAARLDRIEARLDDLDRGGSVDHDSAATASAMQAEIERLKTDNARMQLENDRLAKALDYAISDYGRAARRADGYMSDLLGIARHIDCPQKSIPAAIDTLRAQLADAVAERGLLEGDIASLKRDLEHWQRAARTQREQMDKHDCEILGLLAQVATLTAERDGWQSAARAHESELLARDSDIIDLRAQVATLEARPVLTAEMLTGPLREVFAISRDAARNVAARFIAALPSPVVTPPVAGAVSDETFAREFHDEARRMGFRLDGWDDIDRVYQERWIACVAKARATPAPADVTAALGDALIPGESIATAVARVVAERDAYGEALAAINTAPVPRSPTPVAWMAVSAEGRGCIAFAREAVEQQVADRGYPDGDRETVVYTPLHAAPAPLVEVTTRGPITPPTSRRPEIGDRVRARIAGMVRDVSDSHGLTYDVRVKYGGGIVTHVWVDAADVELLDETGWVR